MPARGLLAASDGDLLRRHLDDASVFFDVDSIPAGADFIDAVEKAIERTDLLLVLIGDDWLTLSNADGRRIDDPDDHVVAEVRLALEHGVPILPVLASISQ